MPQSSATTSSTHREQRHIFAPDFVWHSLNDSLVPLLRKVEGEDGDFLWSPRTLETEAEAVPSPGNDIHTSISFAGKM